jgi:hypothetical protein
MNVLLGKGRLLGRVGLFCMLFLLVSLKAGAETADITRQFVWKSFGEAETLMVKVPSPLHDHYAQKTRTYQYGNYIKEDAGYELTGKLAAAFDRRAEEENLTEWEVLNMVVDFVQSLEYQTEEGEYPKYPIETLKDGGGDCEDTAILLAAIFDKMGIDCVLLSPPGHMAVGLAVTGLSGKHYLHSGKKYYYIETTGQNWEIGLIPASHTGSAKVYALPENLIVPRTVASHELKGQKPAEETMIMLAFYRSPNGSEDPKTHATQYRYTANLETDAHTLEEVLEVQYRRLEPGVTEIGKIPWIRAYDIKDYFQANWTATDYMPVQVRIFFKDGSMVQTLIDFEPKIAAD